MCEWVGGGGRGGGLYSHFYHFDTGEALDCFVLLLFLNCRKFTVSILASLLSLNLSPRHKEQSVLR